jgi:hypothetical protein
VITQHGEDNTMPRLAHAERPADSEGGILKAAQALNIISPDGSGDQKPRQQGRRLRLLLRMSGPKIRAETWLWRCCGSTVS